MELGKIVAERPCPDCGVPLYLYVVNKRLRFGHHEPECTGWNSIPTLDLIVEHGWSAAYGVVSET